MNRKLFMRFAPVWLSLTSSERRGYYALGLLLIITMGINYAIDLFPPKVRPLPPVRPTDLSLMESQVNEFSEAISQFNPNLSTEEELLLMGLPGNIVRNLVRYRESGGKFSQPSDVRKIYGMSDSLLSLLTPFMVFGEFGRTTRMNAYRESNNLTRSAATGVSSGFEITADTEYFNFDPNTVSEEELSILGFTDFQKRNLLAYRERGGRIRQPEDLLRIYGFEEKDLLRLSGWVSIAKLVEEDTTAASLLIDLNSADSIAMLALPGIGPVFAGRIVRYRNQLGGFYTINQLMEVYGMSLERYEGIKYRVHIENTTLRRLRINFLDITDLMRHPYIDSALARRIVSERSAGGPFETLEIFVSRMNLSEGEFIRLEPYLTPL